MTAVDVFPWLQYFSTAFIYAVGLALTGFLVGSGFYCARKLWGY
jgi:hypothetical protein